MEELVWVFCKDNVVFFFQTMVWFGIKLKTQQKRKKEKKKLFFLLVWVLFVLHKQAQLQATKCVNCFILPMHFFLIRALIQILFRHLSLIYTEKSIRLFHKVCLIEGKIQVLLKKSEACAFRCFRRPTLLKITIKDLPILPTSDEIGIFH